MIEEKKTNNMKWIKTFESIASQKSIETLANDILRDMAKLYMDNMVVSKFGNGKYIMFEKYYVININSDKYDNDTKKFIDDTNLKIVLDEKNNTTTKASYTPYHNIITLNYEKEFNEKIQYELNNPEKLGNYIMEYNETKLYATLYNEFNKYLIHELQHAWDDWITKGKFQNTKKWDKYLKNKIMLQTNKNLDYKTKSNIHKQYLKLPHEINARFTDAMKETTRDMWKMDDDWVYHKQPFEDVVKNFKLNYEHWREMSPTVQKRLLHRLYQFWEADFGKKVIKKPNKKIEDKKDE